MDVDSYHKKGNKYLVKVKNWVDSHGGGQLIPFSADYERKIASKELEETSPSALNRIVKACYNTLDLVHYFTVGEDEVRQWTVRKNSKAPQAAGIIHTDFEKGYISCDQ